MVSLSQTQTLAYFQKNFDCRYIQKQVILVNFLNFYFCNLKTVYLASASPYYLARHQIIIKFHYKNKYFNKSGIFGNYPVVPFENPFMALKCEFKSAAV